MPLEIVKVTSKKQLNKFIDFPHDLYKNDPNYVPELFVAQSDLMNPKKNPFFLHGKMQQFLAIKEGKIVGRIAGIVNGTYKKVIGQNDGFFGFFDVVNSQEVANALLSTAESWLKTENITGKMIGPANPSSNDTWGMLVDGFDTPPMAMMPYNFSYYNDLVSNYGLYKQTDLFAWLFGRTGYDDVKVRRVAGLIEERMKRKGITVRPIDLKKNFKREVERIREVYNKAWDKNLGSIPMTDDEFTHLAKDLKMIVDPNFVRVAEMDGKFIGISIAIPNINDILIHIKNGRLFPTGLIKLLTQKKKIRGIRILILGVLEEYRKLGIESVFYAAMMDSMLANPRIEKIEASWILEGNEAMNKALENMGAKIYKTYRVFEKQI
ncbi:hypothetical protein [Rhizosphaericola mali]|uniref:N-acetyltransferase domain-containing protein n=1 Tax=Rhizosphaericola mali TaxID=2545455 RepID=A0A5P2G013_9BACT|nr:hypothetical protein [Rhizosphaericola mali]QES87459.1 hypothetical protein E0W69_001865 [Rhizosphaericola mali]